MGNDNGRLFFVIRDVNDSILASNSDRSRRRQLFDTLSLGGGCVIVMAAAVVGHFSRNKRRDGENDGPTFARRRLLVVKGPIFRKTPGRSVRLVLKKKEMTPDTPVACPAAL